MKPEPLPAPARVLSPAPAPTARPELGAVSWNMNTTCNYRCSYCTQRFVERRDQWARDTESFVDAFGRLPGTWEIKLSGGEPFGHPTFFEIVSALSKREHLVSVVTNFSAPRASLERFVEAAAGSARVFSASLHLEYVRGPEELEQFVGRARWLHDCLRPLGSVCVTCVATREALPRLQVVAERFAREPMAFKVQPEKQNRDVVTYTPEETACLLALGGHNRTGVVVHELCGVPCWSGSRYFIVDHRGAAFRCYPARRYRVESMGNLLDGSFQLAAGPAACPYPACTCTVPIERNMMPRIAR